MSDTQPDVNAMQQFERGRLRAITALRDKPSGQSSYDWLMLAANLPGADEHPSFIAGYNFVKTAVAL